MFKSVFDLCSVVSHLIFCNDDRTFLLVTGSNSTDYELPSIKSPSTSSWNVDSNTDLKEIFGTTIRVPSSTLRVYKTWVPDRNNLVDCTSIFHVVYSLRCSAELKRKSKNGATNKYRYKIKWFSEEDIVKMHRKDGLISPEIIDFILNFQTMDNGNRVSSRQITRELCDYTKSLTNEFCVNGCLVEITENEVVLLDNSKVNNYLHAHVQVIEAALFKQQFQYLLYREFLLYCFPYFFMNSATFIKFVSELGWPHDDIQHLFYAADVHSRYGLTFREFMVILAAIDPHTNHGGAPAEIRCRYMFRYYDRDHDNVLNYGEFKNCVLAVRRSRRESIDMIAVSHETDNSLKDMGMNETKCSITISDFLLAVGNLKFRGTSMLFRSTNSAVTYIIDIQERERLAEMKSMKQIVNKSRGSIAQNRSFSQPNPTGYILPAQQNGMILSHRDAPDYEIAVHTIRLQKSGTMINIDDIFGLEQAVSHPNLLQAKLNPTKRILSQDSFNQKSLPNEILKGLRYIVQMNPVSSTMPKVERAGAINWGQLDPQLYCKNFIKLCSLVRNQFKNEKRLVEISSPVFVLGDLHGNFSDLLYFEKVLWHFGPSLSPVKMLFLGDYVDRGVYSVEVISYLFSYKLQCPNKLFMLRGNHEIRSIQKMFTFEFECCKKFGDAMGKELWNAVNSAFDTMPLAAVIDSQIFCCHGGIPPPWLCPIANAINSIPTPLNEPDIQSPLAWELMWNDPVRSSNLTETAMMELIANEGFGVNTRRGTGHVFSVEALERFLTINGFSHCIRAHEVVQSGFNVQQNGKLLTVFSSSRYCGGINEAACVVVDQQKLRILRLQPS